MKLWRVHLLCVVALTFALNGLAAVDEWVAPGLTAQWVSKDMTNNGVPMSVRALSGSIGLAATLAYYQRQWPAAKTRRYDGWTVISVAEGGAFTSVTLRGANLGCEGFLVQSARPDQVRRQTAAGRSTVPLPHGVRVIAHQAYDDGGSTGESFTLASHQQPSTLSINFHHALRGAGWELIGAKPMTTVSNGSVAEYQHATGLIKLFIHRDSRAYDDQSLILLHRIGAGR